MEQTIQIVENKQIEGSACENVRHFEVSGNNVTAVFYKPGDAADYIKKHSAFKYNFNWYDTVGFCHFHLKYDRIIANSSDHSTTSKIRMFTNGLKNI